MLQRLALFVSLAALLAAAQAQETSCDNTKRVFRDVLRVPQPGSPSESDIFSSPESTGKIIRAASIPDCLGQSIWCKGMQWNLPTIEWYSKLTLCGGNGEDSQ